MLLKPPVGKKGNSIGPPLTISIWRRMKPMRYKVFRFAWNLVEKHEPMTDLTEAKYDKWADVFQTWYYGM